MEISGFRQGQNRDEASARMGSSIALGERAGMEDHYLERLQKGVEVDEDYPGDLILPWVDKEQHVGDPQQGQQHQCSLDCFPGEQMGT